MADGSNGFEPIDVSKRQYIENVVEPDMHSAITQLATARKKIPRRCVTEARKEANNNIYYYGKAHVKLEMETEFEGLDTDKISNVYGINREEIPAGVDSLSKLITTCSEERQELLSAQKMLNRKLDSLTRSKNNSRYKPFTFPHFCNDDFVIDESVPLHVQT